jgi:prophage regulatory protein
MVVNAQASSHDANLFLIKIREVLRQTTLSRSQMYLLIAAGQFPKQIKLSEKSVGWIQAEITAWIQGRIDQSRAQAS